LGLWAIIIAAFIAYVFADAAFDISKKISRFIRFGALPWIRGAWGAVWGRRSVIRESRKTEAAPAVENFNDVVEDAPATGPHQGPVRALSVSAVLAFLWKARWLILILLAFIFAVGLMRGCTPIWAKSRDTLRAELKEARITETVTAHEAGVATKAIVLAEETHRDRTRREAVIAQAEQEIEDAVSQDDFDRLYRAYALGYCGLLDHPECEDRPDPSPSGPPGLRSAPADRA